MRRFIGLFRAPARSSLDLFSVVFITNLAVRRGLLSFDVQQIPQGSGSGFIWDQQGHVVTNFHVVQGGQTAKVTVGVNEYPASLVGFSRDQDLAVLRIDAGQTVMSVIAEPEKLPVALAS